jgi:hypothetical protein
MTAEQAATLKRLAEAAYELEAFQPNLTRAEADLRIAMLTAKLKLMDGPPHTLRRVASRSPQTHRPHENLRNVGSFVCSFAVA